jgi:Asp-tRNA(Asn)/Glu-tRNA(Gln) amidotransferase A subunit family amidase
MQRFVNQIKPAPTPEERDQIRPLVNQAAEDLRRLRQETAHSTEKTLEHLEDQIAAILTPAQRDRFSDLIQHWRDDFQKYNSDQQQRQAQQRLLEQQMQQRRQQQQKQQLMQQQQQMEAPLGSPSPPAPAAAPPPPSPPLGGPAG